MDGVNIPAKFEVRSFTEIIGGTQKMWAAPEYAHAFFSKIFHGLVLETTLWMYRPNLQSVALAVPEIIVIAVLGWGCEPLILGKRRPYGVGDGTVRKSVYGFL